MSEAVEVPARPKRYSLLKDGLGEFGKGSTSGIVAWLHRPLADYYLVIITTLLLLGLGLLMVGSASSVLSSFETGETYYFLVRQLAFGVVGLPLAFGLSRLKPVHLTVVAWVSMIISIILLALIFTPLGVEQFGNRAWLRIPVINVTIQPSEFAKFAFILWAASVFANRTKTLDDPMRLLVPFLPGFLVIEGLVAFQHDMGTAMIFAFIMFMLLWFVGAPFRVIFSLAAVALVGVVAGILADPGRMTRIIGFVNQDAAQSDQPMNAIYALASGGWWGLGLGRSRQKWGGLYNGAQTDYVLAVLGEEMGLWGTLLVFVLFLLLGFAGLRIATRTPHRMLRYACATITGWFMVQALINIFVVFRLLPVLGVPLPFISQGGSSLVACLLGVGVLMAGARSEPEAVAALAGKAAGHKPRITTIVDSPAPRKASHG